MKKNYSLALCLLLCLSLFISCSDDDNNGSGNGKEKLLLSKVTEADGDFEMQYYYDDANRLIKMEETESEDGKKYTSTTIFEYDLKGNPIKMKESYSGDSDTHLTTYTYKDDSIFVKEFRSNSETEISGIDTLIINSNGSLKKIHSSYEYGINYANYTTNSAGQITQEDYYVKTIMHNVSESHTVSTYTYDNKNGFFSQVNVKPWFFDYDLNSFSHFSNPTLIQSVTDYKNLETGGTTKDIGKTENVYTYNENDYPETISVTEKYNEKTDTYFYKLEYIKAK